MNRGLPGPPVPSTRRTPGRCVVALAALVSAATAQAAPPEAHLSLEGMSGFGTIPHAETLRSGQLALGYSDLPPAPGLADFHSYAFGIGLFDGVELGGRLLEGPSLDGTTGPVRDLSANLKLRLFRREGWPSLAVGVQDAQGNRLFPSQYVASSWTLGPVDLNVGYGWESENFSGTFGGIQWRPTRWLSAGAEHAGGTDRVTLRLSAPPIQGLQLSGLAVRNLDDEEDVRFGVELSLPLAGRPSSVSRPGVPSASIPGAGDFAFTRFHDTAGSLTVCVDPRTRYRNPEDALAAALHGVRATEPEGDGRLRIVLFRDQAPSLIATTTPSDLAAYLGGDGTRAPDLSFAPVRECRTPDAASGVVLKQRRPPAELILEPNLISFVATEYGTADIDLSLRARLQLPLLAGIHLQVSVLSPSVRSEDFEDGRNFEAFRSKAGVDQALAQWFIRPAPHWYSLTSIGRMRLLQDDLHVLMQEHVVYLRDGRESLRLNLGALDRGDEAASFGILELAHHFIRHDTSIALAGGRFAAGDDGGRLELTRFFGDTAITAFVKTAGGGNDAAGGMRISFPLTGRVLSRRGGLVLRGAERWSHSQQTTFGDDTLGNALRPNLLVEPLPDRNLRESYLNLDRATPAWIRAHLGDR
jgi:hypothetical protein